MGFLIKKAQKCWIAIRVFFDESPIFCEYYLGQRAPIVDSKHIAYRDGRGDAITAGGITRADVGNSRTVFTRRRRTRRSRRWEIDLLAKQFAHEIDKAQIPRWPMEGITHVAQVVRSADFWALRKMNGIVCSKDGLQERPDCCACRLQSASRERRSQSTLNRTSRRPASRKRCRRTPRSARLGPG